MIDYKISWSPGTNAFGWSGTPSLVLDPLHRGFAAHQKRDWRRPSRLLRGPSRASEPRPGGLQILACYRSIKAWGCPPSPFYYAPRCWSPGQLPIRAPCCLPTYARAIWMAVRRFLARCNNMAVPIDAALWTHYFSQAREGVEAAAALNIHPPQSLDPLVVREPPDHPLTLDTRKALVMPA